MLRTRMIVRKLFFLALALLALPACAGQADPAEAARLIALLDLENGEPVADVGAGEGEMAVAIARQLGESTVWATEIPDVLDELRESVEESGRSNIRVAEAGYDATNLPDGCCAALYLRRVYHHFQHPERNAASLFRTARPGGLVAVIDFEPRSGWSAPEGVPENRGGHGMPSILLEREMKRAGFELVRIERDWPEGMYAALFRRPEVARSPVY